MAFTTRVIWVFVVVFLTFAVHEAAHGLAGAAFGYDMIVRLNGARPADPTGLSFLQRDIITTAGPAITLVQGFVAAWLAAIWRPAFTIVLSAFMMRVLAAVASLRNPNDEARLGLSWDFGFWTLHVLVIGLLALAVLSAARAAEPGWRSAAITAILIIAGMTFVVVIDSRLPAVTFPAL